MDLNAVIKIGIQLQTNDGKLCCQPPGNNDVTDFEIYMLSYHTVCRLMPYTKIHVDSEIFISWSKTVFRDLNPLHG